LKKEGKEVFSKNTACPTLRKFIRHLERGPTTSLLQRRRGKTRRKRKEGVFPRERCRGFAAGKKKEFKKVFETGTHLFPPRKSSAFGKRVSVRESPAD